TAGYGKPRRFDHRADPAQAGIEDEIEREVEPLHTATIRPSASRLSDLNPCRLSRNRMAKLPGPCAPRSAISPAAAKVARAAIVASNGCFGATATKAPTSAVSEQPSAVTLGIKGEPPDMRTDRSPSVTKSTAPVTATTAPVEKASCRAASSASLTGSPLSTPCPALWP